MTLGETIRSARKKAGLTQAELGEMLGVSGSMIGQWENNLRKPKHETLKKVALALGVSISNLLPTDYLAPYEDVASDIKRDMIDSATSPEEYQEAINTSTSNIQTQLLFSDIQQRRLQKIAGYFDVMNAKGQQIAVERVEELTKIPDYQKAPEDDD
ncbi:helix-turn-helix transcriptional regulator [[Clostridium] leptum]|nr:helix-turn-helix transcriptional regulator [[Clostridium] leptum]